MTAQGSAPSLPADAALLSGFVSALPQATLVLTRTGDVVAANSDMAATLGFSSDGPVNLLDHLGRDGRRLRLRLLRALRSSFQVSVTLPVHGRDTLFQIWSFDGAELCGGGRMLALQCDPRAVLLGETRDLRKQARRLQATLRVSERYRAELAGEAERLEHAANHDPITGVHNARAFQQLVTAGLRDGCGPCTLIYLDLNGFKAVNDTHGHRAGDEVLITLARRIGAAVRRSDLVARLGGDEFAVWMHTPRSVHRAQVIERIAEEIRAPMLLETGDIRVSVGVALGVARAPEDGTDYETLLHTADSRMFMDKRAQKARQGQDPGPTRPGTRSA